MNTQFNQRLERALKQRLYLLDTKLEDDVYNFIVEGSTGKNYDVTISEKMECTCPDFKIRGTMCKHIMFIFYRVYKVKLESDNVQIDLRHLLKDCTISSEEMRPIVSGDCSICFEEVTGGKGCTVCVGVYHKECLGIWAKTSIKNTGKISCPLCRSNI